MVKVLIGEVTPLDSPWVWGLPLLCSVAAAVIGLFDANQSLFLWVNHVASALPSGFWQWVTTFGDSLVVFSLALLLVERQPRLLWALMLAAMVTTVVTHGLKEWVLVMRPPAVLPHDSFTIIGKALGAVSFPSGHTASAFAFASLLVLSGLLSPLQRLAVWLLAALVAVSRLAIGVHWPLDVLAGAAIAHLGVVFGLWLAPRIPWGESGAAQRGIMILLVGAALALLFVHDSSYPAARWLEQGLALIALIGVSLKLRPLFSRVRAERMAQRLASEDEGAPAGKSSYLGVAIRITVTAGIFWLILRSIDLDAVVETFKGIVPRLLLLGIVFQMLSTLLASWRWYLVMQRLGFTMSFPFFMRSYFKGSFFNQGLPTSIGGDAIRVLDVARHGFRKREAFYGVFIDRVLGLVGLLLLNLLANALNPELLPRGIFIMINLIVMGGLVGFIGLYLFRHLEWPRRWRPTRIFHTISCNLGRVFVTVRVGATQIGLSIVVHLLALTAIFLVGRSVEMDFDLLTFLIIVPPVILLTLVPVSLAGWGVREGAMIGLFTLIGADTPVVLSMSILYGIVLIVASLPGLLVYLSGRQRI